ncbi:FAD dependent oxidoreductase, partial [Gautieria morchelliformis]
MGVCTAYYLSDDERFKNGSVSVTLVEANEIASGASGKAGGFLAVDWHGHATADLARLSYSLHQQLARELDGEHAYGYRKVKSLNAHVDVPDSGQTHLPDPWLQGRNVTSLDLLAEEDATSQVHPLLFTSTLWNKVRARGVQYVRGRPSSWDEVTKTLKVDTADGHEDLAAGTVVVAAGPWSGRVTQQLLGLDIPIFDLPGHSTLIRPSEPLPAHAVFAQINQPGATETLEVFVRPDGLVYVAGENRGAPLPEGTADVKLDAGLAHKLVLAGAALTESLRLGTVELCYRPVTPHGAPLVGSLKSGSTKAFIAAGHGPWGITLGPGTGKVMSEFVLDGSAHSAEVSQLDPRRH